MQANDDSAAQPASESPASEAFDLPQWVPEPIAEIWQMIDTYPIVAFLVIIVLSYLAAKVAEAILCRGFKRLAEKTETEFDDKLIELVHQPIFIPLQQSQKHLQRTRR